MFFLHIFLGLVQRETRFFFHSRWPAPHFQLGLARTKNNARNPFLSLFSLLHLKWSHGWEGGLLKWELSRVVRADVLQNTAERKREKLRLMTGMENGKTWWFWGVCSFLKLNWEKSNISTAWSGPWMINLFFKIAMKYHRAALQAREDP